MKLSACRAADDLDAKSHKLASGCDSEEAPNAAESPNWANRDASSFLFELKSLTTSVLILRSAPEAATAAAAVAAMSVSSCPVEPCPPLPAH